MIIVCRCVDCEGTGKVEMTRYTFTGLDEKPCYTCDGYGVIEYSELYESVEDALEDYPEALKINFASNCL